MKDQITTNPVPKQEMKNQRQIARKIILGTIINGEYIIEKEQEPNYLKILPDLKIYRVNVIAIVVSKEKIGMIINLLLDDSSEKITARIFEENKAIRNVDIGDCIQLIGKIRIYNEEKYLSPEIIKKIDPLWLKIRNVELKKNVGQKNETDLKQVTIQENGEKKKKEKKSERKQTPTELEKKREKINSSESQNKETDTTGVVEDFSLPSEKIIKLIKERDKGQGVFIEELIEKSSLDGTEKIIERMLENGDIFQNLPGKVKVL